MKTTPEQAGGVTPGRKEHSAGDGHMVDSAFHMLFINELRDIYWAEKQLVKSMPRLVLKAYSDELKEAIESHMLETSGQVNRIESIFENLKERVSGRKCEAMEGILLETDQLVGETTEDSLVRDVAIISCLQKIEHYEIATYGTLRTMAQVMKHSDVESLLNQTVDEEKNADITLTMIARNYVNEPARDERR